MKARVYTVTITIPAEYLAEDQTIDQDLEALRSGNLMIEEFMDMKTYDDSVTIEFAAKDEY